ncbi:MAG: MoaD/ThiS family protein [Alphaproteobacteria bacterium]|nr:MoaD/ThiS family protein [Alphaproteobacteria bacterium]
MNSDNGRGTDTGLLGHNARRVTVTIEVRLFNSLYRYRGNTGAAMPLSLPAGSSVGDILQELAIPADKVFLALRNGRDVTPSLHTALNTETALDEGDVIALSGPVPYSWGYGAPVV